MLRTRLMAVVVSAVTLLGVATPASAETARDTTTTAIRATLGLTNVPTDGTGIDVALLDTGVVPVPGVPASRVLYGPDTTLDALNPRLKNLDNFGHGTSMASLILGVAPGARVVSVKVGSATSPATARGIVAGIDWVVKNARTEGRNIRVLNVSFGLQNDVSNGLISSALRRAWAAGIVVVAAGGNSGNVSSSLDQPAKDSTFVAVGASSIDGASIASFSSGANAFLARQPDVVAPGSAIVGARVPGSFLDAAYPLARLGDDGFRGSGTSQATAVTSGLVALVLQRRPALTPLQVKSVLSTSARPIGRVSPAVQGRGVVNAAAMTAAPTVSASLSILTTFVSTLVSTGTNLLTLLAPISPTMWSGDVGQDNSWSANRWSGNRWSGSTWSANRWSGDHWE